MVFDFDDFHEGNHKYERLLQLKDLRPDFRCTMFAIPGLGSLDFWSDVPDWIELAVHGWEHPDPYECAVWSYGRMEQLLDEAVVQEFFVEGFKAPGWQISDDCYRVLLERGWWVADHPENNERRPIGIQSHVWNGQDHWHGHIQDVCGNGIEETWDELVQTVKEAPSFEFMSEVVSAWH
jgi:hypothetical protein